MSEEPRPGTTASLDRRVERLEQAQTDMQRALDRLAVDQQHATEMAELRFKSIETTLASISGGVSAIVKRFDDAMEKALQTSGDLRATPVGRQVDDALKALEAGRIKNAEAIDRLELVEAKVQGMTSLATRIVPWLSLLVSVISAGVLTYTLMHLSSVGL